VARLFADVVRPLSIKLYQTTSDMTTSIFNFEEKKDFLDLTEKIHKHEDIKQTIKTLHHYDENSPIGPRDPGSYRHGANVNYDYY
uniref:Uncharacterized protein n=1 Tax=Seriola lalandi dorsalis TaxID=1841481 RepID=A0A3B4XCM7_SERLL